ncbi:hypothetical protein MMC22_011855 [Lobaria immixta]|nr:hypothetical protein [Lobaria immixta]
MSPSPASKRRRLNAASSKLSQPFKSPFKTPLKPSSTDPATNSSSNHSPSPLNPANPTATSNPVYPTTTTTVPPLPRSDHLVIARPSGTPRARGIIAPPSPELARLQKRHTALLGALASARASLETHAQALKLETSSTDLELQGLIAKWNGVSREAAEQVLAVVAARVEGMGGVKGWRQKEREKREGFLGGGGGWGWSEEGVGRNVEDEGGGDERDDRETEENERKKSLEEEDDNEEVLSLHPHSPIQNHPSTDPKPFKKKTKTFTMSMMLRSLNIDFQLIGYDPEAQKWID